MGASFECYADKAGEFRFRLRGDGGEVLLASEGYRSHDACANGIASVKKNSGEAGRYEPLESANGKYYFNLKAGNGQVIGTSTMFASAADRDAAIAAVQAGAADAAVDDQSR
jgi:uncharacterized protein YegP (UPF0339 family)